MTSPSRCGSCCGPRQRVWCRRSCSCVPAIRASRWVCSAGSEVSAGAGAVCRRGAEELAGALLGQLLLRRREEVLVLVDPARGTHPGPVASEAKLAPAVALAGVAPAGDADVRGVCGGLGEGPGRGALGDAAELLALGADLGGGFGEGAGGKAGGSAERPFEEGAERADLAAGRAAGAACVGVLVPGTGEAGDAGAPAVSVRREHG